MDPISITATVVTFATAVKDLVELGQKIHESFAKVSKNRRHAQRTAERIKGMVEEIWVFCDDHKDALVDMQEFNIALKELLGKFRAFEASILPLVPQRGGFLRAITFLRGWWNNNKIEESLLELQSNIMDVIRGHMMKSTMRTEVKLEAIHQDTNRGLAAMSHGLEIVRRDVSAIRVTTTANTSTQSTPAFSDQLEQSVIMFAQSTISASTPLLRMPDAIAEDVWMSAFIKMQIHYIAVDVEKVSLLRVSGPSNTNPFSVDVLVDTSATGISYLRRRVVRDLMRLRDTLSDIATLQAVSIHDAASYAFDLFLQLSFMGLVDESMLFANWAIDLSRSLVNASLDGEAPNRAWLTFYLYNLSRHYWQEGDITESKRLVDEVFSVLQSLLLSPVKDTGRLLGEWGSFSRNPISLESKDSEILGLYSDILVHYARFAYENQYADFYYTAAIKLMEGILDLDVLAGQAAYGIGPTIIRMGISNFVGRLFSSTSRTIMIVRCARAFEHLALYLGNHGDTRSARCLLQVCITVHREMVTVHGNAPLAFTLSRLCMSDIAMGCFTPEECLDMFNECGLLLRELTERNPVFYAQRLLCVLQQKGNYLQSLDRHADAIAMWEEFLALASKIMLDSDMQASALCQLIDSFRRANKYHDAILTVTSIPPMLRGTDDSWATMYRYLSYDLLSMWKYKDAAEAARNSVALYRDLGLKNPNRRWTRGLVSALCTMGQSLISLGEFSQGVDALKESAFIAKNVLTSNLGHDETDYLNVIGTRVEVECLLVGLSKHLDASSMVTKQFEGLDLGGPPSEYFTESYAELNRAQICYAYSLYRLGRLQSALQYISEWYDSVAPIVPVVFTYSRGWPLSGMEYVKAKILDARGSTQQALSDIQRHKTRSRHDIDCCYALRCVVTEYQLEVNLGNTQRALEIATDALEVSIPGAYQSYSVWCLFGVAHAALTCGAYQRTIDSVQEAFRISLWPDMYMHESEDGICIHPMLFALISSAEANTGRLGIALSYAKQAVSQSLFIAGIKHKVSAIAAKHSLMETRGYLAEVLLATGDLAQVRQICDERRAYFAERVKDRMGEYRDLAPILRMLGVLCCHEGHHEEGEAAARELTDIITRLGLVFPSLQDQVKIRLRYQASVPILKVLDEMTEKLDCEHQKGISALFKE